MKMGSDNLGIEQDCTAGIPSFTPIAEEDRLEQFTQ